MGVAAIRGRHHRLPWNRTPVAVVWQYGCRRPGDIVDGGLGRAQCSRRAAVFSILGSGLALLGSKASLMDFTPKSATMPIMRASTGPLPAIRPCIHLASPPAPIPPFFSPPRTQALSASNPPSVLPSSIPIHLHFDVHRTRKEHAYYHNPPRLATLY
ncbi:hypothetical protein P280DRAFT_22607 [Massarina eburnea CBS 473.64]|uniref:Uncharacterized protein n=1 Tax=Massarina eburnea CBS 473.64 TaxID=1395130 RepID=A0A6A6RX50_9PLEO|nr:hypothetical protein P280DRAFT_22607 [Massarina eburnea CBS 473.64]